MRDTQTARISSKVVERIHSKLASANKRRVKQGKKLIYLSDYVRLAEPKIKIKDLVEA